MNHFIKNTKFWHVQLSSLYQLYVIVLMDFDHITSFFEQSTQSKTSSYILKSLLD